MGCDLFWWRVAGVRPENPGMPASTCPPRRIDYDSALAWARRPSTRPGAGNPLSRFVNRVPGGRGRELAEGKAGAATHWLEFGAVSAVPSSFLVWREGGALGSPRGCRHSNQTELAGGANSPLCHLQRGNNPGPPYLELVCETT